MGRQVMLNIRMDKGLKAEGDSVLAHAGTSATKAIRSLYRYMETNHEVPSCCLDSEVTTTSDSRRTMMRQLVGVAPLKPGENVEDIKRERLSKEGF